MAKKQSDHEEPKTTKKLSLQDKLAMEKAKTIKDPDSPYSGESQRALDNFVQQVNNVFLTKLLTYVTKQDKCRYIWGFLHGISTDN